MKSAVETLNPIRVKLTVEVPFAELKPSLDEAYRKIGQQINVPGFRKGKVPALVIDQRVGREAVVQEAITDALPGFYFRALQENEITALSQPELDVAEVADGVDLSFTAELDVKPEISLPDYGDLQVEVDDATVSDEDVEEQVEALRMRFGSLNPVERPAQDGDFVTIDLSASDDGTTIEEAQATGMSYQVGRATMLEGLDEALVGMSAGDEKTFASTLVGGEYKDRSVDVTVKVTAVKEQELPDLDDEFAQTASEFDTVDELRDDLRDRLTRGARLQQAEAARDAVLERLLSMTDIPLPKALVADQMAARRDAVDQQLAYAGMTKADLLSANEQTEEEFEAELEKQVRDAIASQFLLDEIANREAVSVDQQELTALVLRRAQQAGVSPEEYAKHATEHNHLPELVAETRRGKALATLVEDATVTDKSGNRVELRRLLPDGTYADETQSIQDVDGEAFDESAGESAGAGREGGARRGGADMAAGITVSGDYLSAPQE